MGLRERGRFYRSGVREGGAAGGKQKNQTASKSIRDPVVRGRIIPRSRGEELDLALDRLVSLHGWRNREVALADDGPGDDRGML